MHRQVGDLRLGPDGLARRGLLVRHLVMPGQLDEARAIFRWLAEQISPDTYVNVMDQYRPAYQAAESPRYAPIARRPAASEIEAAREAARAAALWRFDERNGLASLLRG
jgi:putative pyruvate formate lyase activating enzyme